MDCSPKCRLAKHADFNFSALINITPHDEAKVRAILPRFCSNFARVKDQCGRNVLHLAASCGKCDILEWLVKEEGADLDSKDLESGWTPLHRSLFYGYLECAVKLTQLGSDPSCLDKEGLCPLDLVQLDSPFQIQSGVHAKVVSSYKTSLEDELKLEVGDVIRDVHMTQDKYWTGVMRGKRGHFPKDCVKLLLKDHQLELFTWGSNTNFTLGHKDESTRYTPEILECLTEDVKLCVKEVVMCKFHSVFLSVDGRVFTCGHGRGGRLGHGNEKTLLEPQEVTALKDVKCLSLAAGQDHTVVVTDDGSVYTFGLNDSHQLGQVPPPKQCLCPRMLQIKMWKGKEFIGAAAGRCHSVFFTRNEVYSCGLNAGQLGHPKGETYQMIPRQVSSLADKTVIISKVTCSDAATVCATSKGDIYLLNQYICRRIISRFTDLTTLAVTGGKLDVASPQKARQEFADEITVTVLNSRGTLSQWKPMFGSLRECCWYHNRPITVRDFAVGRQLLIVSNDGEAFVCQPGEKSFSPTKVASRRKPSVSSTSSDTALAQSPPKTTPLSNFSDDKDTCITLTKSFSDSTLLRLLVKETCKKEALWYCLERIPFIHRGLRVFTDSKSKGFAVLQIYAREGLKNVPEVSKTQVWKNLMQLLEEATSEDDIHDVEFLVKGQPIAAHGFVVASRSPKCRQLICKNKDTILQTSVKSIQTISLPENRDYGFALSWLKRLYGGEDISDKELFSKDFFPLRAKNGFQSIGQIKQEKKMSNETDKTNKEKNVQPQNDNENMIAGRMLSDLMYLAERDLDNFGAPTFDYGDSLFDDFEEGLASYAGDTEEMKTKLQSNTSDREDKEAEPSDCLKSVTLSRSNCPELYDVVIVCEDGTALQCHKCILVAQLDYFRSMLASGWLETSQHSTSLKLPFPGDVMEIVLDFLYSGQPGKVKECTDLELLGNILIVADQLLICRLKELCEAVMANLVTLRNVAEVLEFAMLYNASQLRDVCTELLTNNLATVIESRTLDALSDEALAEVSRAYRRLVAGMAWRVITPADMPDFIFKEVSESTPGKRRKSAGRKKSSKSESEQDANTRNNVQEEIVKTGLETSVKYGDEVFDQPEITEDKPSVVNQSDEATADPEHPQPDEKPVQSNTVNGLWYRKDAPKVITSKKKNREKKQSPRRSAEELEAKQEAKKEVSVDIKVPSLEKPVWSSNASAASPPATSLKDIIEQEQNQATLRLDSPDEYECLVFSLGTSPPSAALWWNSGVRQSQKQRKRSKSSTSDESSSNLKGTEGNARDVTPDERKDKEAAPAW
ncbi:unnamed protein product, partial [Porites evermanni]